MRGWAVHPVFEVPEEYYVRSLGEPQERFEAGRRAGVEQDGLLAIGGAAVVALVLVRWRLTRHYEGTIEKLRIEEVTDTDDDGSTSTKKVTFAYIRTLDGKVKKIQARRGYSQGDRLYKRKGDWNPRKVKV